jgi:hypothetical protein
VLAVEGSDGRAGAGRARGAGGRLGDDPVPIAGNVNGEYAGRSKDGTFHGNGRETEVFGLVLVGQCIILVIRVQ